MTTIVVAAAVIERDDAFLVTRRRQGVHLEGYWEFPGGKCETDETQAACLKREIHEELGVDAEVGDELFTTTHVYPERRVELHFLRCRLKGEPTPQLGQDMRWASRSELPALKFPPADAELIETLVRLKADTTDLKADTTDLKADTTDLKADTTDLKADTADEG